MIKSLSIERHCHAVAGNKKSRSQESLGAEENKIRPRGRPLVMMLLLQKSGADSPASEVRSDISHEVSGHQDMSRVLRTTAAIFTMPFLPYVPARARTVLRIPTGR